jgi:hypothetical protein
MANTEALAVIANTLALRRSHPHAPAIDTLDLVVSGRGGQTLNFLEIDARHGSLADPASEFGQVVAEAFDRGMLHTDWIGLTSDLADPRIRSCLLDLWRDEVFSKFEMKYGVCVKGLP